MKSNYYFSLFLTVLFNISPLAAQTTTPPQQTQTPVNAPNVQPAPSRSNNEPSALQILEEENAREEQLNQGKTNSFFMEFVQMLITLGIILVLILLVGWFLKRMLNTRLQQMNVTSSIKILERRSLTPKSSLYLIEAAGKKFLIAETHTGITYLTDVHGNLETTSGSKENASFDRILQEKMKKND